MSVLAATLLFLVIYNFQKSLSFPDTNWTLLQDGKIEINPGKPVIQKFKASRNSLAKIRIFFTKSYNKDGGEIGLKLADETCQNILRVKSFDRNSLAGGYYDFKFSKINDSKDKAFCLSIDFDPQKEKFKKFSAIVSNNAPPESQLLTATGEELKNQSLSMRPAYKNKNIFGDISELNQRISQYKPWFLKHFFLYAVSLLFLAATFIIVIIFVII